MVRAGSLTAVLAVVAGTMAFGVAQSAHAGKVVSDYFPSDGTEGGEGGQFSDPGGVAVRHSTGQVYVADSSNHRIQRFSAGGGFELAWGADVVDGVGNPGAAGDNGTDFEICTVAAECKAGVASGGNPADNLRNGAMNAPQGVAIDQDSGHVYVRDMVNLRVQEFTADGEFVRAWGWDVNATAPGTEFEICPAANRCQAGTAGNGPGQFGPVGSLAWYEVSTGIAISPDGAHVFVVDPGTGSGAVNRRVLQFEADGAFVRSFGTVGSGIGQFGGTGSLGMSVQPHHVAVDANGVVYVSDSNGRNRVQRYDSGAGEWLAPLDVTGLTGEGGGNISSTTALHIDEGTGHLLVARASGLGVSEIDVSGGTPTLVDTHGKGWGLDFSGAAVDPGSGDLYLSSSSAGAHRVYVLDDVGAPPAVASVLAASDVGSRSATLNAHVDSNGSLNTDYQLELSRDGANWDVAAEGVVVGGTAEAVVGQATGLRPNTPYRVRVVTSKGFGNPDVVSSELTFVTDAEPPEVAALRADGVSDTTARLSASINPHSTAATYRFEYGIGDFRSAVPVPDAVLAAGPHFVFVADALSGLQPATTYQYRLVMTSATEGVSVTATKTFTTQPAATAGPGARGYERVSPATVGGVGVGVWYTGIAAAGWSGFGAYDGERFMVRSGYGSMIADGGMAWAHDYALAHRTPAGWVTHPVMTHAATLDPSYRMLNMQAATPDLGRFVLRSNGGILGMFPEQADWNTGIVGDPSYIGDAQGRWEIFAPLNDSQAVLAGGAGNWASEPAISADGSTVAGSGIYHGVAGPGDPSGSDRVAGRSVYVDDVSAGLADAFPGNGVRSLANACTPGTVLPTRLDSGLLAERPCPEPSGQATSSLISDRGATLQPATVGSSPQGSLKNIVSRDGSRVFFLSPDPAVSVDAGVPRAGCTGSGETTQCPAQLYVRQRNVDGSVVTRWISRPEGGLLGAQSADLAGRTVFEGASVDGHRVFFRTSSPLTADDPNAGSTTGPSNSSWDLYMYELPAGPDGDPKTPDGDPAGGELTRISRGPSNGDCNSPHGGEVAAAALRFLSDDGDRLYFTCAAPLAAVGGSDNGTVTSPGGTATSTDTANLYLYEADGGQESWRFVTRLPRSTGDAVAACASTGPYQDSALNEPSPNAGIVSLLNQGGNCVRGTPDGGFITFWTDGRLTADDPDEGGATGDVYAFDADSDELVRISRPQGGEGSPYSCATAFDGTSAGGSAASCFGDMGLNAAIRAPLPLLGVVADPVVTGSRTAFFESRSRLVAEDVDDGYDVYQWRDGVLSLITSGRSGTDGSFYRGNSADGRNVYFATRDRYSWQDTDAVLDVYTARVGGGIPEPVVPVLCGVLAGGCQGGDVPPVAPRPVTGAPAGSGDADPGARRPRALLRVRGLSRRARVRAARTGRLVMVVLTNRPGRVRVVARARIGKAKVRRVGRGSRVVAKRGATRVAVRLSRPARRWLARGRVLGVRVVVAQPGVGRRTSTLRLRRPRR